MHTRTLNCERTSNVHNEMNLQFYFRQERTAEAAAATNNHNNNYTTKLANEINKQLCDSIEVEKKNCRKRKTRDDKTNKIRTNKTLNRIVSSDDLH